ncbi:MAG: hypothetical protein IT381_13880 [Deltaproteobacteria bacterium]|nr:hypothetical protein [Deltaproteobacteria bacterium]
MIALNGKRAKRRTLDVACSAVEACRLLRRGFAIDRVRERFWYTAKGSPLLSAWVDRSTAYVVKMSAEERDAFEYERFRLGGKFRRPAIDFTRSPGIEALRARTTRVQASALDVIGKPMPIASSIAALLATPEWKGSKVSEGRDTRGRPVVLLLHEKSGARCTLYAEGRR